MSAAVALLFAGLLPAADPATPAPLRYLRPADGRFVLDTELTLDGTTLVSRAGPDGERMTLTVQLDRANRVASAEAVLETAQATRSAVVSVQGGQARLKRGGATDFYDAGGGLVVATAPGWAEVLQLVRRYDARKGGRQEFAGLWVHPAERTQAVTFAVERLGADKLTVKDQEVTLRRYQMRLRGGDHLVWVDEAGRVVKVQPPGKGPPVVLEGFEETIK
jgi:hypothetical protein